MKRHAQRHVPYIIPVGLGLPHDPPCPVRSRKASRLPPTLPHMLFELRRIVEYRAVWLRRSHACQFLLSVCDFGADRRGGADANDRPARSVRAIQACPQPSVRTRFRSRWKQEQRIAIRQTFHELLRRLFQPRRAGEGLLAYPRDDSAPPWQPHRLPRAAGGFHLRRQSRAHRPCVPRCAATSRVLACADSPGRSGRRAVPLAAQCAEFFGVGEAH